MSSWLYTALVAGTLTLGFLFLGMFVVFVSMNTSHENHESEDQPEL
jgi:hypothetical protein